MVEPLKIDGEFYPAYKAKRLLFGKDTFQCAETTVSKLIETQTSTDHPGMLLGKVQSGKTRTLIPLKFLITQRPYRTPRFTSLRISFILNRETNDARYMLQDEESEIYVSTVFAT